MAGTSLGVFIAYDDRPAYRRALRTLVNLAKELGEDGTELRPLPWRFDILEQDIWRALAVEDAARAEIVILSMSALVALPEAIRTWLPACLGRRDCSAALVALLGTAEQPDGPDSPRRQFFHATAHNAGWDFFAPGPVVTGPAASSVRPEALRR